MKTGLLSASLLLLIIAGCIVIVEPVPQTCGGLQEVGCDQGEYCRLEMDTCNVADAQGICLPVPEVCTEIFAPVCGCDAVTYANECLAAAAEVNIDHLDACDGDGTG